MRGDITSAHASIGEAICNTDIAHGLMENFFRDFLGYPRLYTNEELLRANNLLGLITSRLELASLSIKNLHGSSPFTEREKPCE